MPVRLVCGKLPDRSGNVELGALALRDSVAVEDLAPEIMDSVRTAVAVAEAVARHETGKADTATTLAGYGITDAYTKTETDAAVSTAVSAEVQNRNTAISAAISAVKDSAPEAFDTLREIADWIADDETGAAAMAARISSHTSQLSQLSQDKVDKVAGKGLSTNDYTNADKTKVDALGTASAKDVPASGNASATQVVMGNDSRLSDARTPTAHTHPQSDVTGLPAALSAKVGKAEDYPGAALASSTGGGDEAYLALGDRTVNRYSVTEARQWVWSDGNTAAHGQPVWDEGSMRWDLSEGSDLYTEHSSVLHGGQFYDPDSGEDLSGAATSMAFDAMATTAITINSVTLDHRDDDMGHDVYNWSGTRTGPNGPITVAGTFDTGTWSAFGYELDGQGNPTDVDWAIAAMSDVPDYEDPTSIVGQTMYFERFGGTYYLSRELGVNSIQLTLPPAYDDGTNRMRDVVLVLTVPANFTVGWPADVSYLPLDGGNEMPDLSEGGTYCIAMTETGLRNDNDNPVFMVNAKKANLYTPGA